jgi:hypothetical protein
MNIKIFAPNTKFPNLRIALVTLAACCMCFLLAQGVTQALTADQAASRGALAAVSSKTNATRGPAGMHHTALSRRGKLEIIQCEPGTKCPRPPLYYRGRKSVEHEPWLFPIFWGSNWQTKGAMLKAQLIKMYKGFSGSAYQGILTQYFDSTGRIGTTVKVVQPYIDEKVAAPAELSEAELLAEVKSAITVNGWPKSINGQYIVLTAPGSKYMKLLTDSSGCGYHATLEGISWSFVPYRGDPPYNEEGCRRKGDINGETMGTASHEYGESATNPFVAALSEEMWNTKDEEYEITDICARTLNELPNGSWVQAQWDNSQGTCSISDANPAFVLAITEEAKGATESAAKLTGIVNPESALTKYFFEWGPLASPTEHKTAEVEAGSGRSNVTVEQEISGLTPKTTYAFNIVAKNSTGTEKGLQQKFKTT